MSLRWQRQASLLNIALRSTSFQNLNSNPEIIINIRSYQQQRLRIQKDPYEVSIRTNIAKSVFTITNICQWPTRLSHVWALDIIITLYYILHTYEYDTLYLNSILMQKDWKVLQVAENSDQDEVRRAYLNLAKIYHPDSGSKEADTSKFQEVLHKLRQKFLKFISVLVI
jgi:DnaJ-domain-containing protein 1